MVTPKVVIKEAINESNIVPSPSTPTKDLDAQTIVAGGTSEFTKSNLDGWSAILVTVKATFNASATGGIRVRWLYSMDDTTFDDPTYAETEGNYIDIPARAGETVQYPPIVVPIFAPYVKIQIINQDTTYDVTVDAWTTLMR